MPGGTLVERLVATGQAIEHQHQMANQLAGALAELVMETERLAAQTSVSDLLGKELYGDLLRVDSETLLPAAPEDFTNVLPQAKLSVREVWCEPAPEVPTASALLTRSRTSPESDTLERERRMQACADSLTARKKQASRYSMFSDPDELREQIRDNLTEEVSDASQQLYKDVGLCQAMVKSSRFEAASMVLVVLSSVWMAVEIDHNHSKTFHEADMIFQVVAHVLCVLFSMELLVRIRAFRQLTDAMHDRWIVFDAVLVMLLVFEVWILGTIAAIADATMAGSGMKFIIVFRVLKLVRILRIARVLQHIPELMVILRGLGRALRAIAVILVLSALNIYIAAIVFTAALDGSALGRELFPSVNSSMGTLMLECTLSGSRGTAIMRAAWQVHPVLGVMLMLFVLVSNITMLGALTGLLVQTVRTVAEVEKEEKSVKQLVCTMEELWSLLLASDVGDDGKIGIHSFRDLLSDKHTAKVLRDLDIDVDGLASVSAFVFGQHHGRLGRKEFLRMVLDVRNSKKATVKDHIETRKFTQAALLRTFKVTAC